jgi:hypothetical protein
VKLIDKNLFNIGIAVYFGGFAEGVANGEALF